MPRLEMPYRRMTLMVLVALGAAALAAGVRPAPKKQNEKPANAPSAKAAPKVPPHRPAPQYASVLIKDVPHVRQKPDFCGEACAAMYLNKLGRPVDQDWVFDRSGLDPMAARGCHTKELATALAKIGFKIGPVWYRVPVDKKKRAESIEAHWKSLHRDLAAGVGSILCTYYDDRPETTEHFRLVLGYDAKTDEVLYHEPAAPEGAYRRIKRPKLLALWPLRYSAAESSLIRLRLEPGTLKSGRAAATFTAADYAQHMIELKRKVPAQGFTIIIQPPFVVIGDESPAVVRRRAVGTVKWAADKLKRAYFTKDPAHIIDVWLFKDDKSYRKHTKEIFNDEPDTPYGYFSHSEKALVMNIHTGGGTLVHEIVHPFVATNFPECPAWLNEGLGSLYEQSDERNGQIIGRTNWRLCGWNGQGGLQKAIREKRVPSFHTLCSTTDYQFYREDPGTNYAQARYLCYYLQEHGLLRKFYHAFHANQKTDPTGYQTLKKILGREDMEQFQKDWEAYVMKLRFR